MFRRNKDGSFEFGRSQFDLRGNDSAIVYKDLLRVKAIQKCIVRPQISYKKSFRTCYEALSGCPKHWTQNPQLKGSRLFLRPFKRTLTPSQIQEKCETEPTHKVACAEKGLWYPFRNFYCARCQMYPMKCSLAKEKGRKSLAGFFDRYRFSYSILTEWKSRVVSVLSQENFGTSYDDAKIYNISNKTADNSSFSNVTQVILQPLNEITNYLTLAFCVLSAISLVLLLLFYVLFPPLRTFGGYLTVALASSLLVGLSCFLLSPHITRFAAACRVVAVVMYYAYLSCFVWMSLFAGDVLKTLSASAAAAINSARGSIIKRFGKFAVIGWLVPLIITVSAVTVDEVLPNTVVSPRFGKGQCYFNSKHGSLSWFYIPVTAAVVANFIISIAIIIVLWRTTRETQRARGSSSQKQLILLSLKVTAIFGLTWSFGLIAALVDNAIFKETAGLINSLHGTLISLSFILGSRSMRQARSRRSSSGSGPKRMPMKSP